MTPGATIKVHGHVATVVSVHGGGKKLLVQIPGQNPRYVKTADTKGV
jgi:hypothetical protein